MVNSDDVNAAFYLEDNVKKRILLLTIVLSGMLSGCTQMIELTTEQEDMVAEYAAGRMINYYRKCIGEIPKSSANQQLQDSDKTAQGGSINALPPETDEQGDGEALQTGEDVTEQTGADNQAGDKLQGSREASDTLVELLNISGVEISPSGYSVNDKYPTDAYSFSVEAPTGYKLLVVEYEIKNTSGMDTVMGVDASGASIKALINSTESVNMYRTMLKSDITNMDGTKIKAGDTKTGVLIFRIKDELAEDVNSVDVNITAK